MLLSYTEENYLKAIFKLTQVPFDNASSEFANTNAIAEAMQTKASSVTDMLKRLADKNLLDYTPYKGVFLTPQGNILAKQLVRKHRLWEVFLVNKMGFAWHEVHDIAEQLEHVQSDELIKRLDVFLNYPKFDPHGDPIPTEQGFFLEAPYNYLMAWLHEHETATVVGVKEHDSKFLKYLHEQGIVLNATIKVIKKYEYDNLLEINISNATQNITVSEQVSCNIYVQKNG